MQKPFPYYKECRTDRNTAGRSRVRILTGRPYTQSDGFHVFTWILLENLGIS